MTIDKKIIYSLDEYSYRNFTVLSHEELVKIWEWRNHPLVRQWMMNPNEIKLEEHLNYVENLKKREDAYYWLIYRKEQPIGVLNVTGVDHQNCIGEPGFYLSPEILDKGEGILLLYNYKHFLFDILHFETLTGHNLFENTRAFQLSLFFGAEVNGVVEKQGRKYISILLKREQFEKIPKERLMLQFVKYMKNNPVNMNLIISDYENK